MNQYIRRSYFRYQNSEILVNLAKIYSLQKLQQYLVIVSVADLL